MASWDEDEVREWARQSDNYWVGPFPMGGKLRTSPPLRSGGPQTENTTEGLDREQQ